MKTEKFDKSSDAKRETQEEKENRLWVEAEAKRRTEVSNKIRKAAEESARRREEEDRKDEAIRIANVEKKIREAAEAATRIREEDAKKIKEVAASTSRQRAREEKENKAIARRMAKEKRLKEAAASRRAKEENRLKEAIIAEHQNAKQENILKEENLRQSSSNTADLAQKPTTSSSTSEAGQAQKNAKNKKMILAGSAIAVLALCTIWLISIFNNSVEEPTPPEPQINAIDVKDTNTSVNSNIDPQNIPAPTPKLAVGDMYNGGIIFMMDPSGTTGKIAHLDDAGPMTWLEAMNIHDQFGAGWRVPTFEELETMHQTIGQGATNSGEFANGLYWSATDYDEHQARLLRFRDGNTSYHFNKELSHRQYRVRAIKDFSQ